MKAYMVSYKIKPGRGQKNKRYIEKVFEELHQEVPQDLHYASFIANDDVTFVHIFYGNADMKSFSTFQEWLAGLSDRIQGQPVQLTLAEVGSYTFFNGGSEV